MYSSTGQHLTLLLFLFPSFFNAVCLVDNVQDVQQFQVDARFLLLAEKWQHVSTGDLIELGKNVCLVELSSD